MAAKVLQTYDNCVCVKVYVFFQSIQIVLSSVVFFLFRLFALPPLYNVSQNMYIHINYISHITRTTRTRIIPKFHWT